MSNDMRSTSIITEDNAKDQKLKIMTTVVDPKWVWRDGGSLFGHAFITIVGLKSALNMTERGKPNEYVVHSPYLSHNISKFFHFNRNDSSYAIGFNGVLFHKGKTLNDHLSRSDCNSGKLTCNDGKPMEITLSEFEKLAFAAISWDNTPYILLGSGKGNNGGNCIDALYNWAEVMRTGAGNKLIEDVKFTDWGAGSYTHYKYLENRPEKAGVAALTGGIGSAIGGSLVGLPYYGISKCMNNPNAGRDALAAGLLIMGIGGAVAGAGLTYATNIPETSAMMIVPVLAALSYFIKKCLKPTQKNGYHRVNDIENQEDVTSTLIEFAEVHLSVEKKIPELTGSWTELIKNNPDTSISM